ncbi:MAG: hypothetical protein KJI70_02550 [Patescibacteria group bacterium]|nr:hypothetical protein [Patescibacteria group bacterium]
MNNQEVESLLKRVVWAIFSIMAVLIIFLLLAIILRYTTKATFSPMLYFWFVFWITSLFSFFIYVKRKKQVSTINRAHFNFFIFQTMILTIIVHYLGTIESFAAVFYAALIIYGVFLLSEKHSFIITLLCVIFLYGLVLLEYYDVVPHYSLFESTGVYKDPGYVAVRLIIILVTFILLVIVGNRYSKVIKRQSKDILKAQVELKKTNKELKKKVKELESTSVNLEEAKETLEVRVKARVRELEELTQSLEEKVKRRTEEIQKKVQELEKFQKFAVGRELKMIELKKKIKEIENNN